MAGLDPAILRGTRKITVEPRVQPEDGDDETRTSGRMQSEAGFRLSPEITACVREYRGRGLGE
jgi:hypothetical protein